MTAPTDLLTLSTDEIRHRLAKWSRRCPEENRQLRLTACIDRQALVRLFVEVLEESKKTLDERNERHAQQNASRVENAREIASEAQQERLIAWQKLQQQAQHLRNRISLPDVLGELVYLDVPLAQTTVHEHQCIWLRRTMPHTIRNARRRQHELRLRSCGFQLFDGPDVPMAPPPERAGDADTMSEYMCRVEAFVLQALSASSTFMLNPGERLYSATAYNHAVRCSNARRERPGARSGSGSGRVAHARTVGKRKNVITDVHSDFTKASGPVVLKSILGEATKNDGEAVAALRARLEHDAVVSPVAAAAEGASSSSWRYAFVNVWRSMDREAPVSEWALALLHPQSWRAEGGTDALVKLKRETNFPENYVLRVPSTTTAAEACRHEWLTYPAMTADEALIFVNFDSDDSQPQHVVHGAFSVAEEEPENSKTEQARRPRISVEVRLLVLIQKDGSADRSASGQPVDLG